MFFLSCIVKSEQAKYLGLELSMMERLMKDERFKIYQRDSINGNFNEQFVIQLTKNYRSHPDLLKIPNELFYRNTLEACASNSNQLCHLKLLPQNGFPMIFHSVHSKEHVRPEDSTSLMNIQEINLVIDYVFKLLEVNKISDFEYIICYTILQQYLSSNMIFHDIFGSSWYKTVHDMIFG